jgi:hypothetical protein
MLESATLQLDLVMASLEIFRGFQACRLLVLICSTCEVAEDDKR